MPVERRADKKSFGLRKKQKEIRREIRQNISIKKEALRLL